MSDNVCDNGYEDLEEDYTIGEEYQEADGDCVEDEYYVEQDAEDYGKEDEDTKQGAGEGAVSLEDDDQDHFERCEEDESVELHGEDDIVFSQDSEHNLNDTAEDDNEDVSQDEDHGLDNEDEEETRTTKDEKEEETEIECTMTEEEKLEEYKLLDAYQRQIDEEQYTLRKLRSIIGHQSEDIERCRKKIAGYTKEAEDRKAMEGMEKLKLLKADRERAVEERRVSTDALAEVRAKRNDKVKELKGKGLKIDHRVTYLIEDTELKSLFRNIRNTLKYNSFATLKFNIDELDDVIFNVANVSDEIDEFLTSHNIKPRDINKLNTKERRVNVLYDKLIKWREYKVEDPDIRPTDYESFMYDPEDMFSDSEDEKSDKKEDKRRDLPRREIRAVRGGSTDKSPEKTEKSGSRARSPIRPPSPVEKKKSPVRPERRAVRGGSPDVDDGAEKARDRPLRAERGGESSSLGRGPPRDQPIRKRRAEPLNPSDFKRRQFVGSQRRAFKRSPATVRDTLSARDDRRPSPREDRRNSAPQKFESGGSRQEDRGRRSRNAPLLRTPGTKSDNRRSISPPFRARKENFQISVRNESYRPRSPIQERSYRHDRSPPRVDRSPPRSKTFRGNSNYRGRGSGRRANEFDRRQGGYRRN